MTLHGAHHHGASWAKPNSAGQPSLLYVTNEDGTVPFFAYQNGNNLSLQGTLTGFGSPTQPCVDQSGDVFIPDYQSTVTEFAHGGTVPLHVFQTGQYSEPLACSIDKVTGNLAVPINTGVLVFAGAAGTPTFYANSPSLGDSFFCAYDKHGNLFVDGTGTQEFTLAALPPPYPPTTQDVTVTGGTVWSLATFSGSAPVSRWSISARRHRTSSCSTSAERSQRCRRARTFPTQRSAVGSWKAGSGANAKVIFADSSPQNASIFSYPAIAPYNAGPSGIFNPFGVAVSKHP